MVWCSGLPPQAQRRRSAVLVTILFGVHGRSVAAPAAAGKREPLPGVLLFPCRARGGAAELGASVMWFRRIVRDLRPLWDAL